MSKQEQQMDIGNEELMPARASSSPSSSVMPEEKSRPMESIECQQTKLDKSRDELLDLSSSSEDLNNSSTDDDEQSDLDQSTEISGSSESNESENEQNDNNEKSPIVSIEAATQEQLEKDQLISEIVVLRSQNEHLSHALESSQHEMAQPTEIVDARERDKRELMERLTMSKSQLEQELRVVMEENQKLRAQLDALAVGTEATDLQLGCASGELKSGDDLSIKYPSLSHLVLPSAEKDTKSGSTPIESLNVQQRRELEQLDARLIPSAPTVSLLMGLDSRPFDIVHNVKEGDHSSAPQTNIDNQAQNSVNVQNSKEQVDHGQRIDPESAEIQRQQAQQMKMQLQLQQQQQQLALLRKDYHAERLAKLQVMRQLEALRLNPTLSSAKGKGKLTRTRDVDKRARTAYPDTGQREFAAPPAVGGGTQQQASDISPNLEHVSKRQLRHAARAARHAARHHEKLARYQARHGRHHHQSSNPGLNPIDTANNLKLNFDDVEHDDSYRHHHSSRRHRRRRAAAAGARATARVARNLLDVAEPLVVDFVQSANKVLVTGAQVASEHVIRHLDLIAERAQQQQQQQQKQVPM